MSKILKLTAENIKRLRAVEITPDGNLVVVAGRNEQGKTSVLDSIMYGLGGGDTLPDMPVRRGAEKGMVELDLGDIVVRRGFTASGGTGLTITSADGKKFSSPQTMLDSLVGKMSFDPLKFASSPQSTQAEILRGIAGLDFSENDRKREQLYAERTAVNRDVKEREASLARMPVHVAPENEIDVSEIVRQQNLAIEQNKERNAALEQLSKCNADVREALFEADAASARVQQLEQEIARMQAMLETAKQHLTTKHEARLRVEVAADEKLREISELPAEVPLQPFMAQMNEANATNDRVRQNKARQVYVSELNQKRKTAEFITRQIDAIDESKRSMIASAKFPIDELGFDQLGGVTYKGIPFAQCSAAERLRVSVAVGLALNPKLRVLLIRDGSLLDKENLALVAQMAAKADAQVWIERVETDGQVTVIIEDGMVQPQEAP